MPQTVESMEEERPGNGELGSDLRNNGERGEGSDHGLRLKVPAQRRGSEVCEAENIEGARESDAGDTME